MNSSSKGTGGPSGATYYNQLFLQYLPVSLFFGVTSLVGMVGNVIVVKFYGRKTRAKTSFTYLVRCLAWADFTVCVLLFVSAVEIGININFTFKYVCKVSYFLEQWAIYASVFLLGIISMDRYRKTCQPFKAQMTVRFARISARVNLALTCLMAARNVITYDIVSANVPLDLGNGSTIVVTGYYCGRTTAPDLQVYASAFNWVDIVLTMFLLCIYSLAYALITRKLVAHRKILQAWNDAIKLKPTNKSNLRVSRAGCQQNDKLQPHADCQSMSDNDSQSPLHVHDKCLAVKTNSDVNGDAVFSNATVTRETKKKVTVDSVVSTECDHSATTSEPCDISNVCPKDGNSRVNSDKFKSKHGIKRSEYQITIMMLWVTVVFLLTLSSFFIGTLLFRREPHSERAIRPLTHFVIKCVFLNSVSNPVIYFIFNASFKAYVKQVIRCRYSDVRDSYRH